MNDDFPFIVVPDDDIQEIDDLSSYDCEFADSCYDCSFWWCNRNLNNNHEYS